VEGQDTQEHEPTEKRPENPFPYDDRPVRPRPEEDRPLERLAGRGQTEGTPMGLGQGIGWTIIIVFALFLLFILGGYLLSLIH
jgi:hypothetical protein